MNTSKWIRVFVPSVAVVVAGCIGSTGSPSPDPEPEPSAAPSLAVEGRHTGNWFASDADAAWPTVWTIERRDGELTAVLSAGCAIPLTEEGTLEKPTLCYLTGEGARAIDVTRFDVGVDSGHLTANVVGDAFISDVRPPVPLGVQGAWFVEGEPVTPLPDIEALYQGAWTTTDPDAAWPTAWRIERTDEGELHAVLGPGCTLPLTQNGNLETVTLCYLDGDGGRAIDVSRFVVRIVDGRLEASLEGDSYISGVIPPVSLGLQRAWFTGAPSPDSP